MQESLFLARHIPFWAIPLMLISAEMAYLFWLRRKKKLAILSVSLCLVAIGCNVFYIYAGGPEKSAKILKTLHRDMKQ